VVPFIISTPKTSDCRGLNQSPGNWLGWRHQSFACQVPLVSSREPIAGDQALVAVPASAMTVRSIANWLDGERPGDVGSLAAIGYRRLFQLSGDSINLRPPIYIGW